MSVLVFVYSQQVILTVFQNLLLLLQTSSFGECLNCYSEEIKPALFREHDDTRRVLRVKVLKGGTCEDKDKLPVLELKKKKQKAAGLATFFLFVTAFIQYKQLCASMAAAGRSFREKKSFEYRVRGFIQLGSP